jgi:hypothetical protein
MYLSKIVPPVLACFTDQDARVRYYACEAMYNIAKVAKGEILIYFNDIFDALCKVCAQRQVLRLRPSAKLTLRRRVAWCRFRAVGQEWRRAPGPAHQGHRGRVCFLVRLGTAVG